MNTLVGKCKYCGAEQMVIADNQADADRQVAGACDCGEAILSNNDYYRTCPFPKTMGEHKKKKKKQNGYKDKPNRCCYYTGSPAAERHEVFPGPNRPASIIHGFQIDVCHDIHVALQYGTTEWARAEALKWKQHFQKTYEERVQKSGLDSEEARKLWMMLIGKNYLEEI